MFLNATSCSKCRLFLCSSIIDEHFKNLMVGLTASQQLNLDITLLFLVKQSFCNYLNILLLFTHIIL